MLQLLVMRFSDVYKTLLIISLHSIVVRKYFEKNVAGVAENVEELGYQKINEI